ncbi:hypothetical protein GUJ93_ZPchr0127g7101 [Zizania palustris]|uniref:Uncharacterized protein n=1 Tax=Zizania palustris TaxID=103762 RepID=A0A8J5VEM0_ZIZPA|nr:hypothetical protein GUJ93_ZPchr0127g7101 [Zizania palustris]
MLKLRLAMAARKAVGDGSSENHGGGVGRGREIGRARAPPRSREDLSPTPSYHSHRAIYARTNCLVREGRRWGKHEGVLTGRRARPQGSVGLSGARWRVGGVDSGPPTAPLSAPSGAAEWRGRGRRVEVLRREEQRPKC